MKRFIFGSITCLVLLPATSGLQAGEVLIAVAANFTGATKRIAARFEQDTGHTVKASFGSTGKLYTQIANGAPFEVFLAADSERPIKAEEAGYAVAGSRFTYARGRLVLWSTDAGLFDNGEEYLSQAEFTRLAIGNPKTAPYGLAAKQVLEHLGLWDRLKNRIVRGDSIAQTFQFVVTGNAPAGFVANAQVSQWSGNKGSAWLVPEDYYHPVEQQAVLLSKGRDNPAAQAFIAFLRSAKARAMIQEFGYGIE